MISANKKYFLKNETFVVRAISDEYSGYGDIVVLLHIIQKQHSMHTTTPPASGLNASQMISGLSSRSS